MSEFEFSDRHIVKYLLDNGIDTRYHKQSLTEYGSPGQELAEIFKRHGVWWDYFKPKPVLNLYATQNFVQEDILMMMMRAFLIFLQKTTVVLSPSRIFKGDMDYLNECRTKDVVGISSFYNSDYDQRPFTSDQAFVIEEFVTDFLSDGGVVVLASTGKISEMAWYSTSFRARTKGVGRDFTLDTGN